MKLACILLMAALLTACTSTPVADVVQESADTPEFLNTGYHEISINNFFYSPKALTVYQGDRVKWINQMPMVKSVWLWGMEPSPVIKPGKTWSYTFTETGLFKYRDQFTQDMEGNITVLPYEERPDIKVANNVS
ncbi:cupredoxin domain-containing protein [Candidatus Woesearchaeota archaeon]|nr:cupredoxin domain-containing protein [Candidatus Woesearchaeota archaeon]